jgi:chromosome partitioning protein
MLDIAVVSGPMPRQTTSAHRRYRREEDTETYPVNVGDNHEWCWHELWTQLTLFELKSDESGLRSPTETASMITVIGGTKGGTGKSTIATNFAVMHAIAGADILLVDADEQGTSTAFTNMRNQSRPESDPAYTCVALTGRAVSTEVRRLAPKYQEVIIDLGGSNLASQRGALAVCDRYVVPFAPRSFDIWALDRVAELVEEGRAVNPDLQACAFLNRADAGGGDNAAAADIIKDQVALEFIPISVGNRKSFARAATSGLSVVELRPSDPKARAEIESLFEHLRGAGRRSSALQQDRQTGIRLG